MDMQLDARAFWRIVGCEQAATVAKEDNDVMVVMDVSGGRNSLHCSSREGGRRMSYARQGRCRGGIMASFL
ncbi:MAG: hypothetical protein PHQ43_00480 [Dehalococcoidales bacterium]|nr:hypothetical protein [Dehalococcoidales bacterium]